MYREVDDVRKELSKSQTSYAEYNAPRWGTGEPHAPLHFIVICPFQFAWSKYVNLASIWNVCGLAPGSLQEIYVNKPCSVVLVPRILGGPGFESRPRLSDRYFVLNFLPPILAFTRFLTQRIVT
jgi:hypothetical protein